MRRMQASRATIAALGALALTSTSCSYWLFSGLPVTDRSRPVAMIETTDGRELGATTELGVLFLGRTAREGPCRVYHFLGPTPIVEDGLVEPTGDRCAYYRAAIDLKTQMIRIVERELRPQDPLVAMFTPDGLRTATSDVWLARDDGVEGNVLKASVDVPPGATILLEEDDGYRFVGLVSGKATLTIGDRSREYFTFHGVEQLRQMLLQPEEWPREQRTIHRVDDITITK